MYGVTLSDNTVDAAGNVVVKSFMEENIIIGGNPARVLGKWTDFEAKHSGKGLNITEMSKQQIQMALTSNDDYLVRS